MEGTTQIHIEKLPEGFYVVKKLFESQKK